MNVLCKNMIVLLKDVLVIAYWARCWMKLQFEKYCPGCCEVVTGAVRVWQVEASEMSFFIDSLVMLLSQLVFFAGGWVFFIKKIFKDYEIHQKRWVFVARGRLNFVLKDVRYDVGIYFLQRHLVVLDNVLPLLRHVRTDHLWDSRRTDAFFEEIPLEALPLRYSSRSHPRPPVFHLILRRQQRQNHSRIQVSFYRKVVEWRNLRIWKIMGKRDRDTDT